MFEKSVYVKRRRNLIGKMGAVIAEGRRGIALFIGNVEAPAQYKDNCYSFRQDSSWLYFFGIDQPRYAAVIDLDNGDETIFADDVEIGDIIWMGPQPSIQAVAESVGISKSAPYGSLDNIVSMALKNGRPVHFIPPSRYYNTMKLQSLVGDRRPSEELDKAGAIGQEMHTVARNNVKIGVKEQEIVGKMEGITISKGWGVSFPTILSQHGETLHNHLHDKLIGPGKLLVIDAGAENNMHYASDFTRTLPTDGKFSKKQREIYCIVYDCNEYAFTLAKPVFTFRRACLWRFSGKLAEYL